MPRIRLVYASLLLYASIFVRLAAGLGYMVVAGRKLPTPEFAALGVLLSVSLILSSIVSTWSFWAQRQAARLDEEAGPEAASTPVSTGAAVTLAYAPLAALMYLGLSIPESRLLGVDFSLLALGAPYVFLNALVFYYRDVTGTINPQLIAYATSLYDGGRLALGYYLVAVEGRGFQGAVEALVAPLSITVLFYTAWHLRGGYLRAGSVRLSLAREWLSSPALPLANTLLRLSRSLPRPFISWTTGSDVAVAYLNVGLSSEAPLIQAGSAASPASYALALRRPTPRDLETGVALYFLFAGLLLSVYASIPHPIATMYNPRYAEASIVVVMVSFYALLQGLASTTRQILMGLDASDADRARAGPLMWRTIKHGLLATLLAYLIAAPATYMLRGTPLDAVIALVLLLAVSRLYLSITYLYWLRLYARAGMPLRDLSAVTAGVILAVGYAHASGVAEYTVVEFWRGIAELAPHVAVIAGVYAASVFAFSPTARRILRAGLTKLST